MNFSRIRTIALKELKHIIRDWQTLTIILGMPVVMMFLYGYALTMDLKNVPVAVESPEITPEVRSVINAVNATELFDVIRTERVVPDPYELFRTLKIKALIRFDADFSADLRRRGSPAKVQVLIDGSDPNTGNILRNVMEPLITRAVLNNLDKELPEAVSVDKRVLYNPRQKSALYFVPGLMAIILLMISAMLTSLAITREKETGTIEQLLVSPVKPLEIVFGKIIPYLAIAAADGVLILFVGYVVFGVSVSGSLVFLAGASIVYIFTSLSIGILVSTVAATQQQAMMMVLPLTMLPSIVLSGFIFPLPSIPVFLRIISSIIPATHYLRIIRGIVLKGVGIGALWKPVVSLCVIGIILTAVSVRKFKVRL